MSEFKDVRDFQLKFNQLVHLAPIHLTKRKLKERVEFLLEELQEFAKACGLEIEGYEVAPGCGRLRVIETGEDQNLAEQADALIDLVYVAKGTGVMLGLPWKELWDDVQRANLAKVPGTTHRGHQVDVTKPAGWVPPQTQAILNRAGYRREKFSNVVELGGRIDERLCKDDECHLEPKEAVHDGV